jgi:hypothetical protein
MIENAYTVAPNISAIKRVHTSSAPSALIPEIAATTSTAADRRDRPARADGDAPANGSTSQQHRGGRGRCVENDADTGGRPDVEPWEDVEPRE